MATPIRTTFQLTGADGGPLRGDVRTPSGKRPAIVICHGFKGFKDWGFFPVIADRLARAGFSVVSFNFSGSGVGEDGERFSEPERFGRSTYSGQLADVQIVLDAVTNGALSVEPSAIGLLGHSMGGGIAVLQSARDNRVQALVTWSASARFGRLWQPDQIPEWRRTGRIDVRNQRTGEILPLYTDVLDDLVRHREVLDVGRAAAEVHVPWLIAHGAADESVPLDDARTLHAANAASELLLVEGAGHTFGIKHPWNGSSPGFDRLSGATVEWFARHLLR